TTSAALTNGTLGLVMYWNNLTSLSAGYAFTASGTVSVLAGSGTATATVLRNTTTAEVSETVTGVTPNIPITFTSSQVANQTTGVAFQQVTISGITTPFPELNAFLQNLTVTATSNGQTSISVSQNFD